MNESIRCHWWTLAVLRVPDMPMCCAVRAFAEIPKQIEFCVTTSRPSPGRHVSQLSFVTCNYLLRNVE